MNSALGATIEAEVVDALNDLRTTWDPEQAYAQYAFVRQPQTFPDVRLQRIRDDGNVDVILGIELKGWYLLGKEGEPSFRMTASPDACAPADLIAIYPWTLTNVISGRPQLFRPFVLEAKYAAELRNHHWEHVMGGGGGNRPITRAAHAKPYPEKPDAIADRALNDGGDNFSRLARTGMMDEYKQAIDREGIAGIPAGEWRKFFKAFVGGHDAADASRAIDRLVRTISGPTTRLTDAQVDAIAEQLRQVADVLKA